MGDGVVPRFSLSPLPLPPVSKRSHNGLATLIDGDMFDCDPLPSCLALELLQARRLLKKEFHKLARPGDIGINSFAALFGMHRPPAERHGEIMRCEQLNGQQPLQLIPTWLGSVTRVTKVARVTRVIRLLSF